MDSEYVCDFVIERLALLAIPYLPCVRNDSAVVRGLGTARFIEKTRDQRPYEFDAEPISLTLSADGESRTITPALIAAVARREEDGDIDVYINDDTGVFVRCGGPDKDKFQRLRRSLRRADTALRIPQRVYEELEGDPDADEYPSSNISYPHGFEEGWIVVADELDYANPLVSTVMDEARRFIATETDRNEDRFERADTALVGLAAHLLDSGTADNIVIWTTDKPAGQAAEHCEIRI